MNGESPRTRGIDLRYAATLAAVALAYFGGSKLGLSSSFAGKQVTALWPPTGVAIAALMSLGYRAWPGVLLGAILVNGTSRDPLVTIVGVTIGNSLGPLLGAVLLRRIAKLHNDFARLRDVYGLLLYGAMIPMLVTATNGAAWLALGGVIPWSAFGSVWWTWWVGDAMGVLIVTPFLLTWASRPRLEWSGLRLAELAAFYPALLLGGFLVFDRLGHYQLGYAVFPFLLWVSLRFGQREMATAILLLVVVAGWCTVQGRGLFAIWSPEEGLILLEAFMAAGSVGAFSLGAAMAERRRSEEALRQAHAQLEVRVRERTDELARANAELERRNEEVEAFVYIVSHDLRTPLVNLQGFSNELENGRQTLEEKLRAAALPPDLARELVAVLKDEIAGPTRSIQTATTKFQRLVEALLRLSRSGREEYRQEVVDVQEVLATTMDSLRHTIEQRRARVRVEQALPKAVGDVTAIGQVFSNLVGNALNYLAPGRPGEIVVGGKAEGGMGHYWVKDNGLGIPTGAQRRLFQVFQRFHPQLSPGEGIGLAIVKRVVERHGGKCWAESAEGIGTTFHVTLPCGGREG